MLYIMPMYILDLYVHFGSICTFWIYMYRHYASVIGCVCLPGFIKISCGATSVKYMDTYIHIECVLLYCVYIVVY